MAVLIRLVQAARTFGYVSCQRWSLALLFLLYGCLLLLTWALSWPLRSQPHKLIPSAQVKKEVDTGNVPDHLEAVRIERDGEINKEFHKEVVVGDLNPNVKKEDPKILLETIFNKADTNNDHLLNLSELSTWISAKIQEHIKQALDENFGLFTNIDNNPRNGVVSWDEYHSYFLKQKGLNDKYVENHDKKHKDLDRALKGCRAAVWANIAGFSRRNTLNSTQHVALLTITGIYRTSSTTSLQILVFLFLLAIEMRKLAT